MGKVRIKDTGPIDEFEFNTPRKGGFLIFEGKSGVGKSHAIDAVGKLFGDETKLTVRQGAAAGLISGFGVSIQIARRESQVGELEVTGFSGRDPMSVVDPGLKDPKAADAARLSALCRLANVKPTPEMFAPILESAGITAEQTAPGTFDKEDLPAVTAALKRDLEAKARDSEGEAENYHGRAAGLLTDLPEGTPDDDVDGEFDEKSLASKYQDALVHARTMLDRRKSARANEENLRTISDALKKVQADAAKSPSERDLRKKLDGVMALGGALIIRRDDLSEQIKKLQDELAETHSEIRRINDEASALESAIEVAKSRAKSIEEMNAALANAKHEAPPSDEEVSKAIEASEDAQKAVERGMLVRAGIERKKRAAEANAKASELTIKAQALRGAASACEGVIGQAIAKLGLEGIHVDGGRLKVDDPVRGRIFYQELSTGQRWAIAIKIAALGIGKNGVLAVSQEAFQALDDSDRPAINKMLKDAGIVCVTARVNNGPLRATTLEE